MGMQYGTVGFYLRIGKASGVDLESIFQTMFILN